MEHKLYCAEGIVEAWYDDVAGALIVRYYNLDAGEHRRQIFAAVLEALAAYRPRIVILDAGSARGFHEPQDEQWFKSTSIPGYKKLLTCPIIYVFPKNHMARAGMKVWMDISREFNLEFIEMPSFAEALAYIKML